MTQITFEASDVPNFRMSLVLYVSQYWQSFFYYSPFIICLGRCYCGKATKTTEPCACSIVAQTDSEDNVRLNKIRSESENRSDSDK